MSAMERRALTRVLHVPPLASASSAPAFPMGSSFHADLQPMPLPPPSLPTQPPARALQGGLSRSFSASGGTAGEHSSLPDLGGTQNSKAAGQTFESPLSAAENGVAHKPIHQVAPADHGEAVLSRTAASGLPPLSPSQVPGASLQQLAADQPAVASPNQNPVAGQVHTVRNALRANQGPTDDAAASQVSVHPRSKFPAIMLAVPQAYKAPWLVSLQHGVHVL